MTGNSLKATAARFQQEVTVMPAEALAGAACDIAANTMRMLLPSSTWIDRVARLALSRLR